MKEESSIHILVNTQLVLSKQHILKLTAQPVSNYEKVMCHTNNPKGSSPTLVSVITLDYNDNVVLEPGFFYPEHEREGQATVSLC